jgi:membrane fusion protein (multidrug efflux system)
MKNKLLMLAFASFSFCLVKRRREKRWPKPYPVVSVETKNVTGYDEYPASIKGVVNNDVRAKIQGYITQVLVDEGQYVTAGQPLFRLETNMLTENADAAKSGISALRLMFKLLKLP